MSIEHKEWVSRALETCVEAEKQMQSYYAELSRASENAVTLSKILEDTTIVTVEEPRDTKINLKRAISARFEDLLDHIRVSFPDHTEGTLRIIVKSTLNKELERYVNEAEVFDVRR